MTPILRLGGVGLVVVLAVGVALFGLRPATIGPGTPTAAPTAQPSSSPPTASATDGARPIPNGTYQASVPVADILARLDADQSLTAADKTDVIDALLHIRGATTLHVEITIADETFTLGYAADSNPIEPNSPWRLYILDPSTIAVDIGTDSSGIQAYRVTKSGQSFTLRASSPAEAGETFVRSVLFETAQFSPKA